MTYSCIAMLLNDDGYLYEETVISGVSLYEANKAGLDYVKDHPECQGIRFE